MRAAGAAIVLAGCSNLLGIQDPKGVAGDGHATDGRSIDGRSIDAPPARVNLGAPTPYPAGTQPQQVAIGDLDGDHIPDLCIAENDQLVLLFGIASAPGTFDGGHIVTLAGGTNPSGSVVMCAIGDVDGDGHADLAVASPLGAQYYLQQQAGVFAFSFSVPAVSAPTSVAMADVDGDGRLDGVFGGSSALVVDFHDANGGQVVSTGATGGATQLAVADLNHDGITDVLAATSPNATALVRQGATARTFLTPEPFANVALRIATADLDGDGFTDYAHVTIAGAAMPTLFVEHQVTTSPGSFSSSQLIAGGAINGLAAADFDNDGAIDLAAVVDQTLHVYVQESGALVDTTFGIAGDHSQMAAGDLNGDGKADVVVVNFDR